MTVKKEKIDLSMYGVAEIIKWCITNCRMRCAKGKVLENHMQMILANSLALFIITTM